MKVLTVAAEVPWPSIGGARTRNANLIRALAQEHEVVVAALNWDDGDLVAPDGVELHTVPWSLPPAHRALEEGEPGAAAVFEAHNAPPYAVSYFSSPALEQLVRELSEKVRPDVAVLTETAMAQFRSALPTSVPWVMDLHDVHAVKQAGRGDEDQAERLRRFEAAAVREAATTVCVSEAEARAAREVLGAQRVAVVPNGVDTAQFTPAHGAGDGQRLVFTGSLHTRENVEGIVWFVQHVLPLVHRDMPQVVLDVVGARPNPEVQALAGPHVTVHADVPSTRPWLEAAGVAVVPLVHGGGTRLKVLEAMATRRAVVTTPIGVAGLEVRPGVHVDVAADPVAFAAAVVRLCRDEVQRERMADEALRAVAPYDWNRIGRTWRAVVESAA